MAQEFPQRRGDVIREVDWLAVAPWLLVLRAVGATIGWPLLFGAVGVVALESTDIFSDPSHDPVATSWSCLAHWPESLLWWLQEGPATPTLGSILRYLGWLIVGAAIAEHATRRLTDHTPVGPVASGFYALRRVPRLGGSLGLLAIPAGFCFAAIWLYGLALDAPGRTGEYAALAWGLVQLAAALPLAVLAYIGLLASPLLVASLVVERSDPFDAVSRTVAYTLQRPGTLIAAMLVALGAGLIAGAVLEAFLQASDALMQRVTNHPPHDVVVGTYAEALGGLLRKALRGFYPAYVFTAGVAVYLVMRQSIDGQPIDEIAYSEGDA